MRLRRRLGAAGMDDESLVALFAEVELRSQSVPHHARHRWVHDALADQGTDIVEVFRARWRLRRRQAGIRAR